MASTPSIGYNPLPWLLGPDGFTLDVPTLRTAFAAIAGAGFTAVQADVPEGTSPAEYRALLDGYGLRPAPGYFQATFEDRAALPGILERARGHAGTQAALGMTEVFIASALTPERIAAPSTGAGFDPARLATVTEQLALACEVITAEGLRPCLHPHVGSWIETETETRAALDGIDPSLLSFGPDTGHLHWAGIDPAAIIRDYRDRVGAVHLKDVHSAVAQEARAAGADYRETTVGRHVWTEPGRGDIDLEAALHALPEAFSGWLVVEVDIPDQVTREESAERSGAWVRERLARSAESQEEKV